MAKFCYNCGSELREGDAFCTKCGKAVAYQKEDVNTVEKSAYTDKNGAHVNNNHVKYIVGATVSVIIVFIIIALCNINKGRSTKVAEENITDSMTETDSLSKEETRVSAKYELIGMSCSKFVSEYEQNGGSVIDGLDSTRVSIGKSDYERRAGWENWLTGFEYNISNDCQIFMLQNVDKDDYCSILLFAENDIITSYYVYWDIGKIDVNMAQYIKETEFEEIKGLDESPTISTMIGTDKNGEKWDNNLVCRPVFQNERYTVQFQAEKFEPKTGNALTDWGKMWFVGFYVTLNSGEKVDSNIVAAGKMFESYLDGKEEVSYDDPSFNGSILICKEQPSEDNNNAKYSIAGRGFSPFYDSDCIDVIGDTFVFYSGREFGGAYYKIDAVGDKMFIYWSESLDMGQYELCGQIGETEETKSREEAEKQANEFFKRIQGTYLNEDYDGTVTIATTEAFGFNNYANYSLEGVGMTTLYDTYCTSVVNGDEYYFELYDECYRIVDGENIMICRGSSKNDCYTVCAYLKKKIDLMNIDTYSLAGRYVCEQNPKIEFNLSMYSDYVEIGDEVGNITIGYLNGLVYWEDSTNLGVMLEDGDSFYMKAYNRNGETILEIDGDGIYSGTYKMVEKYES